MDGGRVDAVEEAGALAVGHHGGHAASHGGVAGEAGGQGVVAAAAAEMRELWNAPNFSEHQCMYGIIITVITRQIPELSFFHFSKDLIESLPIILCPHLFLYDECLKISGSGIPSSAAAI